jgi:GNAT superfamily N-acetyltransferase
MGPFFEDFHAVERALLTDLVAASPPAVCRRAPVELDEIGPLLRLAAPAVDHPFFNRAIVAASADEALLDGLVAPSLGRFAALGVERHLLTLSSPAPDPWLARHGLAPFRRWIVFARGLGDAVRERSSLSTVRVSPSRAREVGELGARAFGLPAAAGDWLGALVGRSGWHTYGALDGDELVATGMLFLHDGVGYLGFAATRESHRRMGAQSALLRRRIDDARALGCRALYVETGEANGIDRQTSEHNIRRQRFEPIGVRHNYAPHRDDGRGRVVAA